MSNIWVPKFKIIEREIISPACGMAGLWRLRAGRNPERPRIDTGFFPNLITDAGLNLIGTVSTWMAACRVGSGSTAPSALDTALAAQIASTTTVQDDVVAAQSSAPYYGSLTRTWRFAAGAAEGNIAEVGCGSSSSSSIFSRALILDGDSEPTTISVLEDEFLDVTYQLRCIPPTVDVESTVNIGGEVHDTITRAMRVTNTTSWAGLPSTGGGSNSFNCTVYSGDLAAVTGVPSGAGSFTLGQSLAYGDGTLYRDFPVEFGLDLANMVPGIRTVGYRLGFSTGMGHMQTQFDPVIAKNNTHVLTFVFRHSWARGVVS